MNSLQEQSYYATEKKFFQNLRAFLGQDLILYCVTGSVGRRDVIPGWSDIDILIVITAYTPDIMKKIHSALLANESGIKIGTTIYTAEEFLNGCFKDPKTLIALHFIETGLYRPKIAHIPLPTIAPDTIIHSNNVDLTRHLHDLKRAALIYRFTYAEEHKILKLITTILKILLIENGYYCTGYAETFQMAQKQLRNFEIKLYNPRSVIGSPEGRPERFTEYVKFLNWIHLDVYRKATTQS